MTRKDYQLIAQAIADVWCDAEAQKLIAESIADALYQNSERFDRTRFLAATGTYTKGQE